jgi:hypothetical protein
VESFPFKKTDEVIFPGIPSNITFDIIFVVVGYGAHDNEVHHNPCSME